MRKLLLALLAIPVCYGQTLDASFDGDGIATFQFGAGTSVIYDIALQSDGKIVAVGSANNGVDDDLGIARFNSDGSLDLTFNSIGYDMINFGVQHDYFRAVEIQSDGKIVAAGYKQGASNTDFVVVRYNTDGTLDNSFDSDGIVTTEFNGSYEQAYDMAIQSDGKILVTGAAFIDTTYNFGIVRYNTNGSLDATFGTGGLVTTLINNSSESKAIAIQTDGKIVIAGKTMKPDFSLAFAAARYNTNGTLDASFNSGGTVTSDICTYGNEANDLIIQPDGKIVAVGKATPVGPDQFAVVRYNTDGTLDLGWGGTGYVITAFGSNWDEARSVVIQNDGKLLVGGLASVPVARIAIACYNTDGTLFTGFGTGGKYTHSVGTNSSIWSMLIQPDLKIVAGGFSGSPSTHFDFTLLRFGGAKSGIEMENEIVQNAITIYPNPATQNVTVKYELIHAEKLTIELIDEFGKVVSVLMSNQQQEMGSYTTILNLPEGLPKGNYFLVLSSPGGRSTAKLIKG